MAKTKKEIEKQLNNIETKLVGLFKDFIAIKKRAGIIKKQTYAKRDNKKIFDLKNEIASL